jgi:hypothetical protein
MRLGLLPLCAGLAFGAVASGASVLLVAEPPIVVAAFGLLALSLTFRARRDRDGRERVRLGLVSLLGLILGMTLSRPPLFADHVITKPPGIKGLSGDLFTLLDRIDREPQALLGTRVVVSGDWQPAAAGHAASVSRRVMLCCAADAVRVGFDVTPRSNPSLAAGTPACVEGFVRMQMHDGDVRYVIDRALVSACRAAAQRTTPRALTTGAKK